MRIVISEFMDEPAVASLRERFDVVYDKTLVDDRAALAAALRDTDALIVRNRTRVDAALLDAGNRLTVVGRLGVGLDNIDVETCAARGIAVIPATGANAQSVAEYVVATAMILLRGAYASSAAVAVGEWPRAALIDGREIAGTTMGLIGFGAIGQLTGTLSRALGMRVVGFDANIPHDAPVWVQQQTTAMDLSALLAESDVVSLHVPLTPTTRNLLDASRLAAMKPGAILINTSRGGVVDEAALAAALRSRRLGGAALDVFEREPLPAGSALADCPNLILTPHIAGVTREANARVSLLIARKVAETLSSR